MDRYELDRAAKIHGYEERDNDPPCSECIHNAMCSGKNCHFDRKWEPEDLEKKYYHVNDLEDRLSDELYSKRDMAEMEWPYGVEGPYFTEKNEWRHTHPKRDFRVRLTIEVNVEARDGIEARQIACDRIGVKDKANYDLDGSIDRSRMADVDIVHQYRIPVKYIEEDGDYHWDHDYVFAKNRSEAEFLFRDHWDKMDAIQDIEDIEEYDEYGEEWN